MKVTFTKSVLYIPIWKGNKDLPGSEQMSVTIQPLKIADLIAIMDAVGGIENVEKIKEGDTSGIKNLAMMMESVGELMVEYCELKGLEDADNKPVEISDLTKYPYYMDLASELIGAMAQHSMPGDEEVKNLSEQPG